MATVTPSTTPSYCTLECPKSVDLCSTHIGLKPAQAKYVMTAFKSKGTHEKSAIEFHGLQLHTYDSDLQRTAKKVRRWTIVSKESKKVHVTFGDSKRIMRYEKGAGVKELRPLFLSEFSDVLPDDISPANVKFQVLDGTFKDYVDLANEQQLEENAKIKAITVVTKENQVHSNSHTEAGWSYIHLSNIVIPWDSLTESQPARFPPDLKPHTIKKDVPYFLWNPVSDGLMQKVGQKVTCSGAFQNSETIIQAKSVWDNEFHLVYNGDGPEDGYLYITAQGEDQEVIVSSTPTSDSIFVPNYYWGQTMFRSKPYTKLYLGSDSNRNATLVTMEDPHYPNPQALFIVNKYKLTLAIHMEK